MVATTIVLGKLITKELLTSERQARYLTEVGRQLTFHLAPGPSPTSRFPTAGPYDERLGYTHLPHFVERLLALNYRVESQARLSPRLLQLIDWGVFPIYRIKSQAGLHIVDRRGETLYTARYPQRLYETFEQIPPLIVHTLLFLENRELLDARYPYRNPSVEWDRFAKALFDMAIHVVKKDHAVSGGSTLATQLEKFRHSPEGRTTSAHEKLRQIVSASLRAYQDGAETFTTRRQLVVDYLNTMPLAATPDYGEVYGLGDGLWAWYDTDVAHVNRMLTEPDEQSSIAPLEARALAYKQVLSLLIALRRPSFYLVHNPPALTTHTNTYLRLAHRAGLISTELRDAALHTELHVRPGGKNALETSFVDQKGTNAVRLQALTALGLPRLYDLDRLDLTVHSTLDQRRQKIVTMLLRQLSDPAYVQAADLRQTHMLEQDTSPAAVRYSVTLYERGHQANLLRLHTDSVDQPFDANRGMRLDLGSTAKLRTLITYLDIIARLHSSYASLSREARQAVQVHPEDRLTLWALQYLDSATDRTLLPMLAAAMERRYAASPGERFFTGGGLHTFANFRHEHDHQILTVREAFRHSVNLVFIRLMRDIVRYYMFRVPGVTPALLADRQSPERQVYLTRFADYEGRRFLDLFYRKYAGKSPDDIVAQLCDGIQPIPRRFAAAYGTLEPTASLEAFVTFMQTQFPQPLSQDDLDVLYKRYVTAAWSLADRGYLSHVHPLELWMAGYARQYPGTTLQNAVAASAEVRQEVYRWLFKTQRKQAQDTRIRLLLEIEAFVDIHEDWQRLGYPFATLVPSYATAIGSSGDRPEALAELMGIIVNDGIRYPTINVQQWHFAAGTPYETTLQYTSPGGQQVLVPEVAAIVKQALYDVVEQGTARRVRGAFRGADGRMLPLGGKTGTGDHRFERFGSNGQLLTSRVVNRAATFVFMIDERFFGTLTAYVPGPEAAHYSFTSALPVQVLTLLAPTLQPLLDASPTSGTSHALSLR
jgi:membrane peptidoglycan carboxypeptidase